MREFSFQAMRSHIGKEIVGAKSPAQHTINPPHNIRYGHVYEATESFSVFKCALWGNNDIKNKTTVKKGEKILLCN